MNALILWGLIAVVGWLLWSTYRRERARIQSILRDIKEIRNPKAGDNPRAREEKVVTLEKDPKTGEYRPVKED